MGADRLAALIEAQRPHLALWLPVLFALGIAGLFRAAGGAAGLDAGGARRRAPASAARRCSAPGRWRGWLLLALLLPAARVRRGGAAQPPCRGAGAALRDDRQRRGAGHRARPLGERPAAGAARPRGDPRARAGAHAGAGARLARPGDAGRDPAAGAAAARAGADRRRRRRRRSRAASTIAGWRGSSGSARSAMRARRCWRRRAPSRRTGGSWRSASAWRPSAHIQARVPGQNGAFAAAILTGDRSGIDRSVRGGAAGRRASITSCRSPGCT